jgi:hypothetical protein
MRIRIRFFLTDPARSATARLAPGIALATVVILMLAMTTVSGCGKDMTHPSGLNSDLTTNTFAVYVMGPPAIGPYQGTPLEGAEVVVNFCDMDHRDPNTGEYFVRAEDSGLTNREGNWSCRVSYNERGKEAADKAYIWVSHRFHGSYHTTRSLDGNGYASATVGLGL